MNRFKNSTVLCLLVLASLPLQTRAQTPPPVPAEYQDLYNEMYSDLTKFQSAMRASSQGQAQSATATIFSASLPTANSNLGPALIQPGHLTATLKNVDGLKALGVKAIMMDVNFPILYRGYYSTDAEYQQYLDYYVRVVQEIRARGMKVLVNSQAMFSWGGGSYVNVGPFYASLSLDQYKQGRMEVCRAIAQNLKPDYLAVIQEPDTEGSQTGFTELGTASGSTALLNVILGGLQGGIPGVKVGAGVGSWTNNYMGFIQGYLGTSVDFINIHIYPVNKDYLNRALLIADAAKSAGKEVGISETWLQKVRDSELGVLNYDALAARDVFSFWAPLDALHLQVIAEMASQKGVAFVSAFWSDYFRSYLDYSSSIANLQMGGMRALLQAPQAAASAAGTYTSTGIAYLKTIAPPDTTAPAAPTGLSGQATSSSGTRITWSPASDNIGAAGYRVYRDGTELTRTSDTVFSDSGLSDGRTYTYSVMTFDASGNVSLAASTAVTTGDRTAPSVPADVVPVAVLSGLQININLMWTPSTDNVGVSKYKVYRGNSPGTLSMIGTTSSPSFTVNNVSAQTTYFFAVAAQDAAYNTSGMSPAVSVTTPVVPDQTPPNVSIGNPKPNSTVTRSTYLYATAYDVRTNINETLSGLAGVQFRIDGINVGPEQTVPFSTTANYSTYRLQFDTQTLSNGTHVITAAARDQVGNNSTAAGVTFIVIN